MLVLVILCITSVLSAPTPNYPVRPLFAQKNYNNKIIGGTEAVPHSIPYQAYIFLDGSSFCGGSLISKRYVLTAAHCGVLSEKPTVLLGAHDITNNQEQSQVSIIGSKVIVNKNYDDVTLENDIALIQLSVDAPLNEYIDVVTLAPANIGFLIGEEAIVSGWGIADDHEFSAVLLYTNSSIITNQDCQRLFGWFVYNTVICLDGSKIHGSCHGDSGGPLTIRQNNAVYQVGIVSYGTSVGCTYGYPSAFSRVSSFRDWIAANSDVPEMEIES